MKYDCFLFDLDGTLTDPAPGITNSIIFALEHMNCPVPKRDSLIKFIGPPLSDSFRNFCGMSQSDAERAIAFYRENFRKTGIFENRVYDGIPRLLEQLTEAGAKVLLATSKPEIFARQILEHFGLSKFFTFAAGSNLDGTRSDKAEVIEYALLGAGVTDRERCVMVGDRKYDILGAKKCGLASIGVLFGYGSREELCSAGADMLAPTVGDIPALVK